MTGPKPRPKIHPCIPLHVWKQMPPEIQKMITANDGIYQQIMCPRCYQKMLIGQEGMRMVREKVVDYALCSDCIAVMSRAVQ